MAWDKGGGIIWFSRYTTMHYKRKRCCVASGVPVLLVLGVRLYMVRVHTLGTGTGSVGYIQYTPYRIWYSQ